MKKYDGVLKRVRAIEEKRGIKYANTDGKLYSTLKVLCILAAIWGMATNLLFVLGHILMYAGTENMSGVVDRIVTVSICTVLIIASLILNKFKIYIISAVLNLLSAVFLILQFANLLTDDFGFLGIKTTYYFRHFIPLALMSIFIVWMTAIAVRAKVRTDRMYKKVIENLYNMYRINEADVDILSDEEWDEFLTSYNPFYKFEIAPESAESSVDEG